MEPDPDPYLRIMDLDPDPYLRIMDLDPDPGPGPWILFIRIWYVLMDSELYNTEEMHILYTLVQNLHCLQEHTFPPPWTFPSSTGTREAVAPSWASGSPTHTTCQVRK
jgi:hypothetical protein